MKYLLSSLILSLLASGCSIETKEATETVAADNQVMFRILSQGQSSGLAQQKFLTLRSLTEFAELWTIHSQTSPAAMPKINFKRQMVIAVFMGEQHTGGYAIRVENIIESGETLQVEVALSKPRPGTRRVMMITQPNMIVVLPRSDKKIIYRFRSNP